MDKLAGKYQATAYINTPSENDWHHVQLIPSGDKSYRWKNRAGVSWDLSFLSPDDAALQVGEDCPYYASGHTECQVHRDSEGNVVALMGPGGRHDKLPGESSEPHNWSRSPVKIPGWNGANNEDRHAFLLAVASLGADWRDLAFLAAIPASSVMNQGRPAVLVPGDTSDKDDDALADFLARYQPSELSVFSASKDNVQIEDATIKSHHYEMDSLHSVTVDLVKSAWTSACPRIVVAPTEDYAAVLLASSIAARIHAPLFFVDCSTWNEDVLAFIQQNHSPSEAVMVRGKNMADDLVSACMMKLGAAKVVPILDGNDAIKWLASQNTSVDYLAVVNPNDRTAKSECASRKISLTAPIYAARRNGLVIPIENIQVYNELGRLEQYDQNALQIALQGLRGAIALCPSPPGHVAIFGGFNVMPTCQTDSKLGNIHAVSDIPYGQLKGDDCCGSKQFRDMPFGRVYAESLTCASLLASRSANYELLVDSTWNGNIVEAGTWGFPELSSLAKMTGLCDAPKRMLQTDIDQTEVLEAAAILHKDHSCATHLGNFANNGTKALYSPAVVLTRGCHAAGIDEGDATNGTVPGKMLGRGCVNYLGAPRSATTASTLTEVTYFHELLYSSEPLSVGQALCLAYNKSIVNHLDGGPVDNYCFENEVLLGDPALVPCFVGAGLGAGSIAAATSSKNDHNIVTVTGPSQWRRTPIERAQLDEWKFQGDLFTYVAGNVEQETVWGPGYDKQELYHVVSVDLPSGPKVKEVKALDATESTGGTTQLSDSEWKQRWWPSGRHFEQTNKDGSTTVRWRVRLLDYDQPT